MHDGITVLSVALCQANYALSILRRSLLLLKTETLKKAVRGRGGIIIERFLDIVSVFFFLISFNEEWVYVYVYITGRWDFEETSTILVLSSRDNDTRRDINGFVRWFYSLGSNCYSRERWCYDRTFFFNAAFQGKRDESYSWSSVLQGRDGIQVERETWRLERVFGQSWPKCVTRDYVDRRLRIQKYILLVRGEIGYRDSWSEWQLNYTLLERRTYSTLLISHYDDVNRFDILLRVYGNSYDYKKRPRRIEKFHSRIEN